MCDVGVIVIWPSHKFQASFSKILELWFSIIWIQELHKVNKGGSRCYVVSKNATKMS